MLRMSTFFLHYFLPPGLVYEEVLHYHLRRPSTSAATSGSAPGPVSAGPEPSAEASNRKRARDDYEPSPVFSGRSSATTAGRVPGRSRGRFYEMEWMMPSCEKGSGNKRRKQSPETLPPTSGSSWSWSSSGALARPPSGPSSGPDHGSMPMPTRASGSSSGQVLAPGSVASRPKPETTDRRGAHWAMKRQGAMRRQGL